MSDNLFTDIDAAVEEGVALPLAVDAVVLEEVQDARHLRKDKHPGLLGVELDEQLVQHAHLAGIGHDVVPERV